jgi:hypothetical protein
MGTCLLLSQAIHHQIVRVNLSQSEMDTLAMIEQAFKEESISHTWAFEWHFQTRRDRKGRDK